MGSNVSLVAFSLLFGFALIGVGVFSLIRKRLSWHLSDQAGSRILFTVRLTGSRAMFFGIVATMGGLITIIPLLVAWLSHTDLTTDDSIRTLTSLIGVFLACLGFVVSCFFEFLQHSRDTAAPKSNKDPA
jgi:hypothetical protein